LKNLRITLITALVVCAATCASAQTAQPATPAPATTADDTRTQYPAFMRDSYFDFTVGSIGYLFSGAQLEPGFQADTIDRPRIAVRADFFGHHFTKHFSAQVTYMRPARFVTYHNINGNHADSQTSLAYAGLTFVEDFPLAKSVSGYVEGGYGVTSRSGIEVNGTTALQSAHYAAGLLGAGLAFHATPNVDVMLGATYSPGRQSFNQPSTRFFTTGLRYNMRAIDAGELKANADAGFVFPENVIRFGFSSNAFGGYAFNDFFSKTVPIFWGGNVETAHGFTVDYQRNVFHTKRVFAFDLGGSVATWTTNANGDVFRTMSVYPLFRFFVVRAEPADVYVCYSLAGPTAISPTLLDGRDTGAHFTFQDFMAVGAYLGKSRRLNAELGIKHYSNGNLFTTNASLKVPLTLTLGVTF
jgi:Lipid A 3-O-deacylase (PagL)